MFEHGWRRRGPGLLFALGIAYGMVITPAQGALVGSLGGEASFGEPESLALDHGAAVPLSEVPREETDLVPGTGGGEPYSLASPWPWSEPAPWVAEPQGGTVLPVAPPSPWGLEEPAVVPGGGGPARGFGGTGPGLVDPVPVMFGLAGPASPGGMGLADRDAVGGPVPLEPASTLLADPQLSGALVANLQESFNVGDARARIRRKVLEEFGPRGPPPPSRPRRPGDARELSRHGEEAYRRSQQRYQEWRDYDRRVQAAVEERLAAEQASFDAEEEARRLARFQSWYSSKTGKSADTVPARLERWWKRQTYTVPPWNTDDWKGIP